MRKFIQKFSFATINNIKKYDAIIIGAGHNGLVCANYLAKKNLKTLVLERRNVVGGLAVSEEIFPGYTFSRASYLLSLFRNKIIKDIFPTNWKQELKLIKRPTHSFTPTLDGRYLAMTENNKETLEQIKKFSAKDAAVYNEYNKKLDEIVKIISPFIDIIPTLDPIKLMPKALKVLFSKRTQSLDKIYQIMTAPAATILDQFFESDVLKATLASDSVIGAFQSPYSQGSSYVLIHHVMGEIDGTGDWYFVKGGMGAISEYLAKLAKQRNVDIQTDAEVVKINANKNKIESIEMKDGRILTAPTIISNTTHFVTFNQLIGKENVPSEYMNGLQNIQYQGTSVKFNLVLNEIPQFSCLDKVNKEALKLRKMKDKIQLYKPYLSGTTHVNSEHMQDIHTAYVDAFNGEICKNPMIELTIPQILDDSLNKNNNENIIAQMFVQYASYKLKNNQDFGKAEKKEFINNTYKVMEKYAPGFIKSIVHEDVLFPDDMERIFNLTGGNLFHGSMNFNTLFFSRPMPGFADYTTPFSNLFMCGSGQHPGGGVLGGSGMLCAEKILKTLKI